MEKTPIESGPKAVYTQRWYDKELNEQERKQITWAEENGYVTTSKAGQFLFVNFFPITDPKKLPNILVHVTTLKNRSSIERGGVNFTKRKNIPPKSQLGGRTRDVLFT